MKLSIEKKGKKVKYICTCDNNTNLTFNLFVTNFINKSYHAIGK